MALMQRTFVAPTRASRSSLVCRASAERSSRRAMLGMALIPAVLYAPKALALIPGRRGVSTQGTCYLQGCASCPRFWMDLSCNM